MAVLYGPQESTRLLNQMRFGFTIREDCQFCTKLCEGRPSQQCFYNSSFLCGLAESQGLKVMDILTSKVQRGRFRSWPRTPAPP